MTCVIKSSSYERIINSIIDNMRSKHHSVSFGSGIWGLHLTYVTYKIDEKLKISGDFLKDEDMVYKLIRKIQ
jgi:hypothetical protein